MLIFIGGRSIPWARQGSIRYSAGGTPLAVQQEVFLVYLFLALFVRFGQEIKEWKIVQDKGSWSRAAIHHVHVQQSKVRYVFKNCLCRVLTFPLSLAPYLNA